MNTSAHDRPPKRQNPIDMNLQGRFQGESRGAQPDGSGYSRPLKTAPLMLAFVGGLYLQREPWEHVAGNWIYLLLACPVMHLFHGQGGHGDHAMSTTKHVDKEE